MNQPLSKLDPGLRPLHVGPPTSSLPTVTSTLWQLWLWWSCHRQHSFTRLALAGRLLGRHSRPRGHQLRCLGRRYRFLPTAQAPPNRTVGQSVARCYALRRFLFQCLLTERALLFVLHATLLHISSQHKAVLQVRTISRVIPTPRNLPMPLE